MKPKTLFCSSLIAAAAMSTVPAFAEDTATADSVLINFNSALGTSTTEGTWNDTTTNTGSAVALVDSTGAETDMTATWTAHGTWQVSSTAGNILNGYLDDNNNGTNVEITIGVSNVSYLAYDVSIYCATDKGSSFSAKTVNGSTYTYADGATTIGNTSWGSGSGAGTTIAEGSTYFTVSGLFGDLSISSKGDNVGESTTADKTRGSIAAVTIVDTSVKYSPELAGASDLTWTSTALAGGDWKNASAQNGWSYADMTLSADTSISVSDNIDTIAVFTSGTGALTLNGSGAINMLLGSQIKAGEGTSIDIQNTVNFANGGTLSGTVTTSGNGVLKVAGGTLDATSLAATAPSLNVSLESGATYVMDLSSASATHDLSTISGVSGSVVSIAGSSSSSGNTFTKISALSSDFKGTVKITSGFLNLADPTVMNNSGVEKIILSGGTGSSSDFGSGLCFVNAQGIRISKDIVAEGNGGALRSYASDSYSVEFTGDVSGTSIRHNDGGTHTFSGNVDLETFTADAGVTNFSGTGTNTIGTLYSSTGTINIGDGTNATVVSATRAEIGDSSSGTSTLNIKKNATLAITGNNNGDNYKSASLLLSEWANTTTANISGTLLAKDAKLLRGDYATTLNISGGTLAVKGFYATKNSTNAVTVNVSDSGKLILGSGDVSGINAVNVSLNNGTFAASESTITFSKNIALTGAGTIDTTKYDFADDGKSISQGTDAATITLAGVISGTGALNVSGAGTLTLSGANTFTGNLTVSSGTLEVASTGSLTLSGTTTLSSAISNSGAVTVNSTAVFVLKDALKTSDSSDITTYTLISNGDSGSISGWDSLAAENFTLDGAVISGRSTVNVETAGKVTITGKAANLVWNGGTSGSWDVQTTQNWTNSGTGEADYFVTGDNVTFSSKSNVSVTVADGGVTVGTMTVATTSSNAGRTVTLSGGNVTANVANITAGTLLISSDTKLTTNNGITVSGTGTLKISSKTNIGGNVTVGTGGTFDVNGQSDSISESSTGFGTITLAGGKLVNNGSSVGTDARQLYTLTVTDDSEVGGTGNFGIIGSGYAGTTLNLGTSTLTKTGSNTFWLVNTAITGNGGTLEATAGTLGGLSDYSIALGEGVSLKTSGTAGVSALSISSMGAGSSLSLSGSGTHTLGSLAVGSDATVNISGSATISGTFSGAGTLNVNDGGVLEMEGNSSATNQVQGTINVKGGGTLNFSGHDLTGWSASTDTVAVLAGDSAGKLARLDINDTGTMTFTHVVAMNGNALISKSTSSTSGGKFNTLGGKITATGTNNTISDVEIQIRNDFEVEVSNDADVLEITSAIVSHGEGTGGITKTGTGTLILSGNNSGLSTGAGSVRRTITVSAGTVVAKTASALGSTATTVNDGGVLKVSVNGGVNVGEGSVTFNEGAKFAVDLGAYSDVQADKALTIITASAISFNDRSLGTVTLTSEEIEKYFSATDSNLGDWATGYTRTWGYENNALTLTLTIPEPSTFGLLAGVGALALVAARRRRRAK